MAKKKKNALPKRLAGVKVPKSVRKSKVLQALMKSDIGRDVIANALTAGAGAAAAVLVQNRENVADTVGGGAKKGVKIASLASEAAQQAASAALGAVSDAAKAILPQGKNSPKSSKRTQRQAARH